MNLFHDKKIYSIGQYYMYDYIIYHKNCIDGFSGFFILALTNTISSSATIYPDVPSTNTIPPNINNKNVICIDVAYKPFIIEQIFERANSVVFIDHHDSLKDDIKKIKQKYKNNPKKKIIFDIRYSGVGLTWKLFHPKKPFPLFVKYIQDNDIGAWKIQKTIPFINALQVKYKLDTSQQNINKWKLLFNKKEIDRLVLIGQIYDEYKMFLLMQNVKRNSVLKFPSKKLLALFPKTQMKEKQYNVAVTNSSCPNVSMLGKSMVDTIDCDFAFLWSLNIDRNEYVVSLRSKKTDVGKVASYFNGGGHVGASAFSISANKISVSDMFDK